MRLLERQVVNLKIMAHKVNNGDEMIKRFTNIQAPGPNINGVIVADAGVRDCAQCEICKVFAVSISALNGFARCLPIVASFIWQVFYLISQFCKYGFNVVLKHARVYTSAFNRWAKSFAFLPLRYSCIVIDILFVAPKKEQGKKKHNYHSHDLSPNRFLSSLVSAGNALMTCLTQNSTALLRDPSLYLCTRISRFWLVSSEILNEVFFFMIHSIYRKARYVKRSGWVM